jgi:REP element-mobilizing transposase RayT
VIMPDHFHILITLPAQITVEKAAQLIKGGFAFRAGREIGFRAPVWQKGFSEVRVTTGDIFQRFWDYIQANPVKRCLVKTSEAYPYSSAAPGFALDPPPQRLKPAFEGRFSGIAKAMP